MVLVSYSGKEINAKLVYYGPGLSGKTTNLEYIYGSIPGNHRGKMVSMKTKTERTLFFDFLPVQLGELSGFKTRFLLYTVPGQVYYNATRKLVLKGVDAVVFVADSKRGKMDENVESLENLKENLRENGIDVNSIPWVLQYNKRDLPEVYSVQELDQVLNPLKVPTFEAVATNGNGVIDTFKGVSRLLLKKLSTEVGVPIVSTGAEPGVNPGAGGVSESPAGAVSGTGTPAPGGATRTPSGQLAQLQTHQPPVASPRAAQTLGSFSAAAPVAGPVPPSGGIVRSDGSIAEAPPAFGETQVFESHASPASTGQENTSFVRAPEVQTPMGSDPKAESSRISEDEEVPPISRMERSEPPGGVRKRLARWLKRSDEDQSRETEDCASDSEPTPRQSFFPTAEPAARTAEEPGANASPGEPLQNRLSGAAIEASADAGVQEPPPMQADPAPALPVAQHPGAGARFQASADVSGPPVREEFAPSDPAPVRPLAATGSAGAPVPAGPFVVDGVGRGGARGSGAGQEPRELVIPVRLRPEDLEAGIVVKLKIEAVQESTERTRRAA